MTVPPEAARPRLCVSIPVHEQPAVILDQVENLRAFLGQETQVVLHLSAAMGLDPAAVAPLLPEGVHVNPVSHPSQVGDLMHLHVSNLEFAYKHLEPFDHVLLHASNDLYVRPGAPERIAATGSGYASFGVTPDEPWLQAAPAWRDRQLAAILADLGADTIHGGQVEGSYFAADLFRELLDVVGRRLDLAAPRETYNREEIWFFTIARHLRGEADGRELVYADVITEGPTVSPAVVFGVLDGSLAWRDAHDAIFAVKRVARAIDDPNRVFIRGLARAATGGRRLALARTFAAKRFVALAFAPDVLDQPELLRRWHMAFGPDDDATLLVLLDAADRYALEAVTDAMVAAAETAGPGAADVALVLARDGTFEEATLRWTTDVVLRPDGASPVPPFDDRPLYRVSRTGDLVYPVTRTAGAGSGGSSRAPRSSAS